MKPLWSGKYWKEGKPFLKMDFSSRMKNEHAMLTQDEILKTLRAEKPFLRAKYGVVEIGLFGSYAAGTYTQESDIDLLVNLEAPRFEYLAGLQIFLETKFNKKVEIVRKSKNLKSRFIKRIEEKVIYA